MMDIQLLRHQAIKTGLGLKYLSKEEHLTHLLKQLNELFSNNCILKGGTALNKGYLQSLQKARFSEDIDLDYHTKQTRTQSIETIKKTMENITDFTITKPRLQHHTLRFDCYYTNQLNEKDRIQTEFYLQKSNSVKPPQPIIIQPQYIPAPATLFTTYCLEDLLAQKLTALYKRNQGKDIYDIFYALDLSYNKTYVKQSLTTHLTHNHITLTYKEFIHDLLKKIDHMQSNAYYIGNTTKSFHPKNTQTKLDNLYKNTQRKNTNTI